jgi:hypothetical protein
VRAQNIGVDIARSVVIVTTPGRWDRICNDAADEDESRRAEHPTDPCLRTGAERLLETLDTRIDATEPDDPIDTLRRQAQTLRSTRRCRSYAAQLQRASMEEPTERDEP